MSLRETIEAAKKEAAEAGALPLSQKDDASAESGGDEDRRGGFTKKSAARAKPAREVAAGVRIAGGSSRSGGKPEREMSKEEKRLAKQERRDREDRRAAVSRVMMNHNEQYHRGQRIFWALMIAGLAITLISWAITYFYPETATSFNSGLGMAVMATIVLAYLFIIAAFVYDWRVVRPIRRTTEELVSAMSDKKVHQVLQADADELARQQAAKQEAKQARRAARGSRHEQHK